MFKYRIKNCMIRIYKIIPIILLLIWGALTVLVKLKFQRVGISNAEMILQQYYSFFYPACLIFLSVVVFYPYIEGEGRELLYVHQRMYIFEALISFLILCAAMLLSVFVYWKTVLDNPLQFYIKNVIILFCFAGICYFLIYTFGNITIMTVGSVIFFIITMLNQLRILSVLPYEEIQNNLELLYAMRAYILIGVICFAVGIISNKKYFKYTTL